MRHKSLSQQPSAQASTVLAVTLMGVPEGAPGVETEAVSPKARQQREGRLPEIKALLGLNSTWCLSKQIPSSRDFKLQEQGRLETGFCVKV